MNERACPDGFASHLRAAHPALALPPSLLVALGGLVLIALGAGCNGRPGVKPFGDGSSTVLTPDGATDAKDAKQDVIGVLTDAAKDALTDLAADTKSDALPVVDAADGPAADVPPAGPCVGAPDGLACDDGNKCTQRDTCQSGQCVGDNPVLCGAADSCHTIGLCNPDTGVCNSPAQADGTTCDDGNKCTQADACKTGVCVGTAVVCKASDQCHDVGTCDAASGLCSNPAKAENAECDDGNKCTQSDVCKAGTCTGVGMVCQASDQCHSAGTCDVATGVCSNPAKADGISCSDGDACTRTDTCQTGQCKGSNLPGCMSSPACKAKGECVQVTDCTGQTDGTICDDGNACTQKDVCTGGQCTGTTPVVCKAADQCHDAGTCDTQTGACSNPSKTDGAICDDGNACTAIDTCKTGVCAAGAAKLCAASDQCHSPGSCNPSDGACTNPAKSDGAGCSDGNSCTQTDTCTAGKCGGSNPKTCSASDQCHVAGTCDPANGNCSNPVVANGKTCEDNDLCTSNLSCQNGVCQGGTTLACPTMLCQTAGKCAPTTGKCTYTAVANGTGCKDTDFCTINETCMAGKCVSGGTFACNDKLPCQTGVCSSAAAACVYSNADGATCTDGNMCTTGDVCRGGTCVTTGTLTCNDRLPCQSGTCDKTAGCQYANVNGADCSKDKCNIATCAGGTCGTPVAPDCKVTNTCLVGSCDATKGCITNPVKDGNPCMTGKACTVGETCVKGVCQGGGSPLCVSSDACCGKSANGGTCDAVSDTDCPAVCGNRVVEPGEACDTGITGGTGACPTPNNCVSAGCNLRAITGTACQAECTTTPNTTCSATTADGCCPSGCTATNDADCPVANDTCDKAVDISKGGVYPIILGPQVKQELPDNTCGSGADVFFTFTLAQAEWVYIDALAPKDTSAQVRLALELYAGGCPTATSKGPNYCGLAGDIAKVRCGGAFPVIDSGSGGVIGQTTRTGALAAGTYVLAVRLNGGSPGSWNLRFDHVPTVCATGELVKGKTASVGCAGDAVRASCDANPGAADASLLVVKCPSVTANFTSCIAGAAGSSAVDLSATAGSLSVNANRLCAPSGDGAEVACAKNGSSTACKTGGSISVTDARSGLLVVSANSLLNADNNPTCNANAPAFIAYPTQ